LKKTENIGFMNSGIICQQSLQLTTYADENCIIVVIYVEEDTFSSLQRTTWRNWRSYGPHVFRCGS